jgi:hypothetical protein
LEPGEVHLAHDDQLIKPGKTFEAALTSGHHRMLSLVESVRKRALPDMDYD